VGDSGRFSFYVRGLVLVIDGLGWLPGLSVWITICGAICNVCISPSFMSVSLIALHRVGTSKRLVWRYYKLMNAHSAYKSEGGLDYFFIAWPNSLFSAGGTFRTFLSAGFADLVVAFVIKTCFSAAICSLRTT